MKRICAIILLIVFETTICAQEIINYFEVSSNIATPVTVKTNLGTFQIEGGESLRGNITSLSAYDAYGNLIVQNSYYKSEWNSSNTYHYRYYRFESTYNQSTSNNNSYNRNDNTAANRAAQGLSRTTGQLTDMAIGMIDVDMSGCPNLQIRGGLSLTYGEFVGLSAELGGKGGMILGGGVGKDYFRGVDSLSWYIDWGMYMGNENDLFVMGLMIGKSIMDAPRWSSTAKKRLHWGSGIYIGWEHYFEDIPRLGIFVIGQLGLGSYDLRAGISWKIFAKLPYFNFN